MDGRLLGDFATRVSEKMFKALPQHPLTLKHQILSQGSGLEHEDEALACHWGSPGRSLEVFLKNHSGAYIVSISEVLRAAPMQLQGTFE